MNTLDADVLMWQKFINLLTIVYSSQFVMLINERI